MKILRIASLALALLLSSAPAWSQGTAKIGVFDPNKLLANSKLGQTLQDDMNKWRVGKEAELKSQSDALEKRFEQYKTSVATMSPERKEQMETDLQKSKTALERAANDADTELSQRRLKATQQIEKEISAVLPDFAQKGGYTIILERAMCAWAATSTDVTADLVRLLDARPKPAVSGH